MLEAMKRVKWLLGRHPSICNTSFTSEPLGKFVILLPLFVGSAVLEALIPKGGNIGTRTAKIHIGC